MGIAQVLWSIFAFALIVVLAYYVSRYYTSFSLSVNKSRYIRVIDKYMVGRDKYILLICIDEKYYLLGITNNNINLISTIENLSDYSPAKETAISSQSNKFTENFKEILVKKLHKNR